MMFIFIYNKIDFAHFVFLCNQHEYEDVSRDGKEKKSKKWNDKGTWCNHKWFCDYLNEMIFYSFSYMFIGSSNHKWLYIFVFVWNQSNFEDDSPQFEDKGRKKLMIKVCFYNH